MRASRAFERLKKKSLVRSHGRGSTEFGASDSTADEPLKLTAGGEAEQAEREQGGVGRGVEPKVAEEVSDIGGREADQDTGKQVH